MAGNVQMRLGEWLVRLVFKLIALGTTIFGAGGFVVIGMRVILPSLDSGRHIEAACTGIASIAALYGLTPLSLAVEKSLLGFARMPPLNGSGPDAGETRQNGKRQ